MDDLTTLLITKVKPIVKTLMPAETDENELEKYAKNLLGKIGVRIVFGADVYANATRQKPTHNQ